VQFYPLYEQRDPVKVREFVESCDSCQLITLSGAGEIHSGLVNPVVQDGRILLHLNRADEQVADLKARPNGLVVFREELAIIPSTWVDPQYAGAATAYYRYVEYTCDAQVLESEQEIRSTFQTLMEQYQPEHQAGKDYAPIEASSSIYKGSFEMICIIRLNPTRTRTKWKLGQNRPPELRLKIAQHLEERGRPGDRIAARCIREG
jgi:predicted FMN-binding regulatory protein PaiB